MNHNQNNLMLQALETIGQLKKVRLAEVESLAAIEKNLQLILDELSDSNRSLHETGKTTVSVNNQTFRQKAASINEDRFDIILDLPANRLRYREYPHAHSPLIDADLKGIGHRRIEILQRLLKNPSMNVSTENTYAAPGKLEKIEPNTLTNSISLLRKALGKKGSRNPYIITEKPLGHRNHVYTMSPHWTYLVFTGKK